MWAAKHEKPPLHYITTSNKIIDISNFGDSANVGEYVPVTAKDAFFNAKHDSVTKENEQCSEEMV